MGEIKPNWSEEKLAWINKGHITFHPFLSIELCNRLTPKENHQFAKNLELVTKMAEKLANNMLKGLLKYTHSAEERSVEEWLDYLIDDATDTLNYVYLLASALRKEKENGKTGNAILESCTSYVPATIKV